MRVARVLLGLFALSFGFAFATVATGQQYLAGTPIEQFAPPSSAFNYTTTTNPTAMIGDFLWGTAQIMLWVAKMPAILAAVIASVGVPEPWASAIVLLGSISLAAYIIYMVSSRIFSPRYP